MRLYLPLMDNGLGMCRLGYLDAFIKAFAQHEVFIDRISDSHPGRGRNRAAASFLATDCEYLLFIDTDIIFSAIHLERLAESAEPLLCGLYPLKCKELKLCLQTLPGHQETATGGLLEVRRTGTGFMRIHRSVFEQIKPNVPRYTNHRREEWDFFQSGVVNEEWLSEDWFFCDLARQAGFKVMVDTRIQLGHEGSIVYPLQLEPQRLALCPPDMKEHVEAIWKGEYAMPMDPPPRTVLDLGANIGGFTVWIKEQFPEAEVLAYEPHPDNCCLFRQNTKHHRGIEITETGIRATNGVFDLIEGTNAGEHSFHFDPGAGGKLSVPCMPASCLQSCELVKLDTEGCELEILQHLDLSATRFVVLEYHSVSDQQTITTLLQERGFILREHNQTDVHRGILKFARA